jgi:two-component system, LytTR family, response regulator
MLTAIIIDDETSSRNSLRQKLTKHCPEITITGECENGEEGVKDIEQKNPDIIFLDVEMPRMNGFTMLKQLTNKNFEVVFITAYDHYAIRAIKFSALDYLVKPIEIASLKAAVDKAVQKRKISPGNERLELLLQNLMNHKNEPQRIAIPSLEGLQFVETANIIYLEASSNYTCFYLTNNTKITVAKTLKDFEEMLPGSVFIRIHNSFIVNKNQVEKYINGKGGQVVMKNGVILDVARRKKEEFMKAIAN